MKALPETEHSDSLLLYSTKKGSLVRVSHRFFAAAQQGVIGDAERATLSRLELWVDDAETERIEMAGLVERTNATSTTFSATVVLTMACNLACPYCFEDNFRRAQNMSEATARLFVAHVEREHISRGHDVNLRFYGGEPLMAMTRLKEVAAPLRDMAGTAGTKFSCSLVTNATLLTRAVVEELLPFGLVSAQITLDGPAEIHDRQRPYVSGAGSFSTIVANLREVYDLITLKPGGNFTRENYWKFPAMLDALLDAGIDPKRLGPVQFAPVHPKSGGHDPYNAACSGTGEAWQHEAHIFLREETLRRGFSAPSLTMGICMIELADTLVVNHDGTLYKCPAMMGWPEFAIGTLADGIQDYRQSHNLDVWKNDECLDCAYLPLCFGGCRFFRKLQTGAIDGVDCRRAMLDASLETIVRQDLVQRAKRKHF